MCRPAVLQIQFRLVTAYENKIDLDTREAGDIIFAGPK
jgi:hypothetical protein